MPVSTTDAVPVPNAAQIAAWNGKQGRLWRERQADLDANVQPFGDAAIQLARPMAGERVIDVGCGCGTTTLEIARRIGPAGSVLGVDVSAPMLAAARDRVATLADRAGLAPIDFLEADAAGADLPTGNDLVFSRFGVMFFDQPASALARLRAALRPGGRLAFVCWRAPRDNPWAMAPLMATRHALSLSPPPADPHLPGPFAFADDGRLRQLLAEAGFVHIDVQRFDAPVVLGASPRAAAETATQIGPAARLAAEAGPGQSRVILDAIERALAPLAAADGRVCLNGSTWTVLAVNPA
jgi:ubiquinone/menaquinone biosynthesis C-methylase UbiE